MTAARPLTIREFAGGPDGDDLQRLVALWQACRLTRPWNDPRRDIERKLADSPWGLLVGCVGGAEGPVVASVMVGFDGHRGSVYYLAVAPDHQGRGYGTALMDRAEALLRARGCPKINLFVRAENAAVIGFYQSRGYLLAGATDTVSLGLRLIPDD